MSGVWAAFRCSLNFRFERSHVSAAPLGASFCAGVHFYFEMRDLGDLIHGSNASVERTGVAREGPETNTLANCLLPVAQPGDGAYMKCAWSTGRIVPS